MTALLHARPEAFVHPGELFIDGAWTAPSSDDVLTVITPSTEDLFAHVAAAREVDVVRAVAAARHAFDTGPWPRMTPRERAGFLSAMGQEILTRADQFALLWTSEVGVSHALGSYIMPGLAAAWQDYAALAETFEFEERHPPKGGGAVGLLVHEPVGVVAAITAWNAPLALITHKVAPALLAGCTVVLKASPEAPGAANLIAEIGRAVGLPAGVLNVLTADRDVSEALVRHPDVDKVTFTGSNAAGRAIGAICGGRIARCTLELGGKSAAVVYDDYEPEAVAALFAQTTPAMSGQVCSALTRVIVSRHRHDALVEAMAAAFSAIRVGDPFDPAVGMGPLATARHRDRVEHYIAQGKAEGAKTAFGGGRPAHLERGYYVEPTIFAGVDNAMTVAREEIFGPVLCVIPVDSEAQALEVANDSPFGLNASIFTHDTDRAYAAARRLRSGTVGHNAFRTDFSIAFGGFKQSGVGREGGAEGLRAFLESKTVILDADTSHGGPA